MKITLFVLLVMVSNAYSTVSVKQNEYDIVIYGVTSSGNIVSFGRYP